MTLYICRCPHLRQAEVFTASSEAEMIRLIAEEYEQQDDAFATALEASRYDMRDAYVTDDPFDLALWIAGNEAPKATGAMRVFYRDVSIRADIEAAATRRETDDDIVYDAFDGRFTWSINGGEWTLGNREPVEADDLAHALVAAHRAIAFESAEQVDV